MLKNTQKTMNIKEASKLSLQDKKEKKERKKKSLVCPLEIRDSSRFQVPQKNKVRGSLHLLYSLIYLMDNPASEEELKSSSSQKNSVINSARIMFQKNLTVVNYVKHIIYFLKNKSRVQVQHGYWKEFVMKEPLQTLTSQPQANPS